MRIPLNSSTIIILKEGFETHFTCVHSDATRWGPPVVLQFVLHNARLLFGAMHPNPMALNAFVGPCPPSSPAMQGPRH